MNIKLEIKNYLLSISDQKYLNFQNKLNIKHHNQLGIRVPLIKEYAKKLAKEYNLDYLYQEIDEEYYEELLLKGFIIGYYKNIDINNLINYIKDFVPKINDWAICDMFCANLKITKKYLNEIYILIKDFLKSNKEFEVRFALIMLLDYYLIDDYIKDIYNIINNAKLDYYYVKMANAWLISVLLVKYFDRTYLFLKNDCKIEKWTYNKSIQKALESFRLNNEQKDLLKSLKR